MSHFSLASITATIGSITYSYNINGQPSTHVSWGSFFVIFLIAVVVCLFYIVCLWKIFKKAGRPGWAAIIPIYNSWVTAEIAGKPGWWSLLFLIPFVNIIAFILFIIVDIELCKRFGKGVLFAVVLVVLVPIIGLPILAFGKAKYNGGGLDDKSDPKATPATPNQPLPTKEPVLPPSPASTITPTGTSTTAAPIVGNDMQPSQPVVHQPTAAPVEKPNVPAPPSDQHPS